MTTNGSVFLSSQLDYMVTNGVIHTGPATGTRNSDIKDEWVPYPFIAAATTTKKNAVVCRHV